MTGDATVGATDDATRRVPTPTRWMELPPGDVAGSPPPRPTIRRGIAGSALGGLLTGLPWFLISFAVVGQLASYAGRGWATVILAVWLLSGGGVFVRPVENAIARLLLRVRPPTQDEQWRLDGPWSSVLHAAGLPPTEYTLWVQDSRELNAYASAGHIVIVTRTALRGLPPQQLAAVLAHELGHHLRGEAWIGLLVYWYSLPGRIVMRLTMVVLSFVLRLLGSFRYSSVIGLVLGLAVSVLVFAIVAIIAPAMLVLFLMTPLAAYFARLDELRADRIAARLGFGPTLLVVLRNWLYAGHGAHAGRPSLRARLLATHPPLDRRIAALEPADIHRR